MKRAERSTDRGPLYKHFDLERKSAKFAEARLGQQLQSLEDIHLYHMKLLAREQRQLQKDLQRLQQGVIEQGLSSYLGNGIKKRSEDTCMFLPQEKQKHRVPEPKIRAVATNRTQEIYKTKSQMPLLHHFGLRDPMRSREHRKPQRQGTAGLLEEKLQTQEEQAVNLPQGVDPNGGTSVPSQDQEVPRNSPEQGLGSSPAGDSGTGHAHETGSKDANPKPGGHHGKQAPPGSQACAGKCSEGQSSKPTYLELFSKIRHAHYLRHRAPPESERLLSIGEIFGHGEHSPDRAGKVYESRVTCKFLPL